ncbi:MAG TPA: helix-turn-helix transcriptional regulator, partial [Pseudonocardiaceae bacterium]
MTERICPDVWDEPDMRRALAERDISTVYQLLRAAGLSQSQISRLTGQSQSEVSEIIAGRRVQAYDVLVRIAAGLGIPRGWMGLAQCDGQVSPYPVEDNGGIGPEVDDEMISRRILGMASAALLGGAALDGLIMQSGASVLGDPGGLRLLSGPPGALGKYDLMWITKATERLRTLDHEHGGAAVYGAARGMAEQVVGSLRSTPEPSRDLRIATSRLCSEAGWSAYDAGRKRDFWQCQATALDLAREAGDTTTVLTLVEGAGRAEMLSGNHHAAAKLFELISVRKNLNAVEWGLLGTAYAPQSPSSAKGALAHLRDAEGSETQDATSMIGHVSLDIGDYPTAVAAYSKVLPQRTGRLAVQETVPLAMAYLKTGDVAVGIRHAERALTLSESVRSAQC